MKTLHEWMSEKNVKELSRGQSLETDYDEGLVQAQVNDWITKLVGLCYEMPTKEKKKMTEEIVKAIRSRMLKS